jgi:hypothetical protein
MSRHSSACRFQMLPRRFIWLPQNRDADPPVSALPYPRLAPGTHPERFPSPPRANPTPA